MLWGIDFWKPTVIFNFKDFLVEYNPIAKTTYTRFPDNHWVGGEPEPANETHADILEIAPELHELHRQLALHLICQSYFEKPYSTILWNIAHGNKRMTATTAKEGWLATAIQYHARGKVGPDERNDVEALNSFHEKNIDPNWLGRQLQTMLDIVQWL